MQYLIIIKIAGIALNQKYTNKNATETGISLFNSDKQLTFETANNENDKFDSFKFHYADKKHNEASKFKLAQKYDVIGSIGEVKQYIKDNNVNLTDNDKNNFLLNNVPECLEYSCKNTNEVDGENKAAKDEIKQFKPFTTEKTFEDLHTESGVGYFTFKQNNNITHKTPLVEFARDKDGSITFKLAVDSTTGMITIILVSVMIIIGFICSFIYLIMINRKNNLSNENTMQ